MMPGMRPWSEPWLKPGEYAVAIFTGGEVITPRFKSEKSANKWAAQWFDKLGCNWYDVNKIVMFRGK